MHVNFDGIATLIGAVSAFIVAIGTFVMQVINWRDNRRSRVEQATHKEMLQAISKQVGAPVNGEMVDKSG